VQPGSAKPVIAGRGRPSSGQQSGALSLYTKSASSVPGLQPVVLWGPQLSNGSLREGEGARALGDMNGRKGLSLARSESGAFAEAHPWGLRAPVGRRSRQRSPTPHARAPPAGRQESLSGLSLSGLSRT